ncbi:hypothetical protein TRFO_22932 [Tritrichomonas foetus]|uniref:Uncharacterized protein n=1 Tax=Tritrichomonas foetus TaxID=1144522 RepID=A0A1J4KAS7_9EUKA|nr:hypothetical protein TRFO_22932 [Tritrichomonas foetus]|eukprot:OHT08513.1 hypothetical protein TRFO_22932 [Tritrichomonas foetus]
MDEFRNSSLQISRLKHISFYLKRALNDLSYDPIVRQMERHKISADYSAERIVELFSRFLVTEREEYISQIEREISTAKQAKKSIWQNLKEEISQNERKLQSIYDTNIQLRRQLNTLQTIIETNEWKNERILETSNRKESEFKKEFLFYQPALLDVRENSAAVLEDLSSLRREVVKIQTEFDTSLRNMYTSINEKLDNIQTEQEDIDHEQLRKQEMQINFTNENMKSSIITLLAHLNNNYQKGQVPLSLNNIEKDFEHVLKDICRPYPVDSDMRKATSVRCKVENTTASYELEWSKKVHLQQRRMKRLQEECTKAEKRLKQLLEADSCIDMKLLAELEKEHSSYTKVTTAKTDQLVELALSQSSSMNSDIDLNFGLSPIPRK